MSMPVNELLNELEKGLSRQHILTEPSAFFRLLFQDEEVVQIKIHNRIHPADAEYLQIGLQYQRLVEWTSKHSESGIQFCMNSVPSRFLEKLDYLQQVISSAQPQWERLIPDLQDELSLAASLFDEGRTFFIEADCLPSGEYIKTTEDKLFVLKELLSSGLPISYVLETGGRGPHIGIVLDRALSKSEFDQTVKEVLNRLPPWIDSGVGRVNQMERMPGTTRINKMGEVATVRLIYLGHRVQNHDLKEWIEAQPIINFRVTDASPRDESNLIVETGSDDHEEAAWAFIREHNLKSAKRISNGKILVGCPKSENHKSGRDRNMSAVVFVQEGHIWCSACQATVGRTFKSSAIRKATQSPLIRSSPDTLDLNSIKPIKIF